MTATQGLESGTQVNRRLTSPPLSLDDMTPELYIRIIRDNQKTGTFELTVLHLCTRAQRRFREMRGSLLHVQGNQAIRGLRAGCY